MIRFAEKDTEPAVIIVQSIIFLISLIIYAILKSKIKKSNDSRPYNN